MSWRRILPKKLFKNSFSSRNTMISHGARKDDEGVYGEYTQRRTDAALYKIMGLQQKGEFCNGLYVSH